MSMTRYFGTTENKTAYDLSTATVSVLVPEGAGYRTLAGTAKADGTFSIPNVPAGGAWLRIDDPVYGYPEFIWTEASQLDLGNVAVGDPSVPLSSSSATRITVDPAAPGLYISSMDLLSPKAGFSTTLTTSSSWPSTLFTWTRKPLLSTSRETDLIITGLDSGTTAAGDTYRWITGYAQSVINPFTMQDGLANTVQANLVIQAKPSSAWAKVNRDAFTAGPFSAGTPEFPTLTTEYRAQFLGASVGPLAAAQARLLTHATTTLTGTLDTGSLAFGDPYPAAWTRLLRVAYTPLVPYTFGTGTGTYTAYLQVGTSSNWKTDGLTAGSQITPLVGPVGNFKLNGQPALTALTGVGATPTLSWDAPSLGTAAYYTVWLVDLDADQDLAFIRTPMTSVKLPAGLLTLGHRCVAVVKAYYRAGGYDGAHPYTTGWPYGYAAVASSPFIP